MDLKIELFLSGFAGLLVSLLLCALIAVHGPGKRAVCSTPEEPVPGAPVPAPDELLFAALPEPDENRSLIRDMYENPDDQNWVLSFFASLCGSPDIAAVILASAAAFDVAPSLAFALCWEESRYNPQAINRSNGNESIDRGLFQLNDRSFPDMTEADFYNPGINARYGMSHLRMCFDSGGSEIAALAMYNAGTGRVRSLGAPKNTLNYIHRILEYQRRIEGAFQAAVVKAEPRTAGNPANRTGRDPDLFPAKTGPWTAKLAAVKPARPWFAFLAPLTGWR